MVSLLFVILTYVYILKIKMLKSISESDLSLGLP